MSVKKGKIIVIAAPSGCGKSTIIEHILDREDAALLDLNFSISATTRAPRPGETNGVNYYFISKEEFRSAIEEGKFVEYEEVYPGRFYGTLHSEIDRITAEGHNVLLDIDVNGAMGVKERYGANAMTVFIKPPSIDELKRRLVERNTETPETIAVRINRAEYELSQAPNFDRCIVNEDLNTAVEQTAKTFLDFISGK